jgi:creatinine amidohydrolase
MTRRCFDQSWPDLGDLADANEVGLVPVGALEQHGPHLPTGTDTIIATAMCEAASERCGAPVLPAIPIGTSYGHGTAIPGTISLTPELLAAVVRQYAEWAATSGLADGVDLHANRAETSVMLAVAPHLVDRERMTSADTLAARVARGRTEEPPFGRPPPPVLTASVAIAVPSL